MKRMPILFTLVAVILLSASLAYWGLQAFKPQPRPQAAVAQAAQPDPAIEAAAGLFGGQSTVVVSNYQLKGVVAAVPARDSVAIIVADGKPPVALKVGHEIAPGVVVKEVQPRYIMLSEGGVLKRVELPVESKTSLTQSGSAPSQPAPPPPAPGQPPITPPPPTSMSVTPTIVAPPNQ